MAQRKIHAHHRGTWIAVTIGIAGLVVGYGIVLMQTGGLFAGMYQCPLHHLVSHSA
jgi:hypothetical protein